MQMIGTPDLEHIEHLRYAWWMLSDGCITNFMAMLGFRLEAKNRTVYKCIAYTPARYDDCTAFVVRRECMDRWISTLLVPKGGSTRLRHTSVSPSGDPHQFGGLGSYPATSADLPLFPVPQRPGSPPFASHPFRSADQVGTTLGSAWSRGRS